MTRWLIRIGNYNFDIIYKPGKFNGDADALSRWYYDEEIGETEEDYDDLIICAVEISIGNEGFNDDFKQSEQDKDPDIKWIKN